MRIVACVCGVLFLASFLPSQEPAPSAKLSIGTTKSAVDAAFGKRFGLFRVDAGDDNALIGMPIGVWDVYHLTAPPDRMYVTIIHFGNHAKSDSASDQFVDSLMLEPADKITLAQILSDQPAFASVCKASCEIVLVTNKAGNRSLLLRPKDSYTNTVLYFEGDSGTIKSKSVTSMESIVSWAYALPRSAFEAHHSPATDQVIGNWSPPN
jgi:hypothetical protein